MSSLSQAYRRLLPSQPVDDTVVSENAAPRTPKRPSITAACEACRQRKSKCSGERPRCKVCLQRSTECRYATTLAETHSQALKRKYEELLQQQDQTSPHKELFELLKSMSAEEALEIFRRIKAGHDVKAILDHVRDGNLLLQLHLMPETRLRYEFPYKPHMPIFLRKNNDNPYLDSLVYESTLSDQLSPSRQQQAMVGTEDFSPYMKPYHAAVLVEALLSNIKISAWTNVTSDESLLGRLMHQYFLHQYSFWPFFHKDYFLQDLKFGRKRFCSALLVNAILADACHGLSQLPHRNEPWNPSSLGYRFFAETRRLCELEAGKNKITTVQALLVMSMVFNLDGFDNIGSRYLGLAIQMSHEMKLFTCVEVRSKSLQRVRELTAWAIFTYQTSHVFAYFKAPLTPKQPEFMPPDPLQDPKWYGELFVRYPTDQKLVPLRHPQVFHANCQFRIILNEIAEASWGRQAKGMSLAETIQFYERLQNWLDGLPTCFTPRNIVLPAHLQLHMYYFQALVCIFEPHVASEGTGAGPLRKPTRAVLEFKSTPQQVIANARAQLETLIRLHYIRHSFETYDPLIMHLLSIFSFLSVGNLSLTDADPERVEATYSSVILAGKGIRDQARSCQLARVLSQFVRNSLGPEHFWLWKEGMPTEEAEVHELQMMQHSRTNYPVNIVSIAGDVEKHRLGNLIKETIGADFDDSSGVEGSSRDATPDAALN